MTTEESQSTPEPAFTPAEALAFIESLRLPLARRVGFRWMAAKLTRLSAFVEATTAENARLRARLDGSRDQDGPVQGGDPRPAR